MSRLPLRTREDLDEDGQEVWDSITAFRNDEYLWWQVAEYTYDSFMIRTRTRS